MVFFWDDKGEMAEGYARALKFSEGQPAWDIYLLFNCDTEWKDNLPTPAYWMHQLPHQPPELLLDGEKLAGETNKLLQAGKK